MHCGLLRTRSREKNIYSNKLNSTLGQLHNYSKLQHSTDGNTLRAAQLTPSSRKKCLVFRV